MDFHFLRGIFRSCHASGTKKTHCLRAAESTAFHCVLLKTRKSRQNKIIESYDEWDEIFRFTAACFSLRGEMTKLQYPPRRIARTVCQKCGCFRKRTSGSTRIERASRSLNARRQFVRYIHRRCDRLYTEHSRLRTDFGATSRAIRYTDRVRSTSHLKFDEHPIH